MPWSGSDITEVNDEDVEEIIRSDLGLVQNRGNYSEVRPWIPQLNANTRKLFSYFSENVAPVMVILDTDTNGYREHILPMALENDVLRRAVGVVAAQHLTRAIPDMKNIAESGRADIISRLRTDSLIASEDQVFDKFTWATLIVLLVGETVTAGSEYSFLVQMLLCLSANSKTKDEDSEVLRFLQTQTNMFELLRTPLLGEDTGVDAFQKSFRTWQEWLTSDRYPVGSENYRMLERIRMCFVAAGTIYIRRATSDNKSDSSAFFEDDMLQTLTIQDLIKRISDIPPESPGAHALVWPCFVAGAESSDPTHRKFFADYMRRIYARTKFLNVLAAVENLETLWTLTGYKRWTQCLPELSNVLII